jgi:hypothetical protein
MPFKVQYKNKEVEYQVSTCPIWAWIEELLDDLNNVSLFQWNTERHYKFDWEWFIDEPWTADNWWNIQISFFFENVMSIKGYIMSQQHI